MRRDAQGVEPASPQNDGCALLGSLTPARRAIGGFGGEYTKFLSDDTREVSEDIGKMLLEF